jgi:hypothetical protein
MTQQELTHRERLQSRMHRFGEARLPALTLVKGAWEGVAALDAAAWDDLRNGKPWLEAEHAEEILAADDAFAEAVALLHAISTEFIAVRNAYAPDSLALEAPEDYKPRSWEAWVELTLGIEATYGTEAAVAQELAQIEADSTIAQARWHLFCIFYRAEALEILVEAGLITKADQPDGSAILSYPDHKHPAVQFWLRVGAA